MDNDNLVIKAKSLRGNDGYKTFSIRIKDDTTEKLNQLALETGHSRNELVGLMLDYALNHYTVEK